MKFPPLNRDGKVGRRFASPRLVGLLNSWRRERLPVFDFSPNDDAIVHGAAFANWFLGPGSTKDAGGIKLVQNGTSDEASIFISGLQPSTGYWMKLVVDSRSSGANGNVRLVAWADTGNNIAGSGGALINFGSGGAGAVGTFYRKVFTDSSGGPHKMVLKHATSPDTEWFRIAECRIFPVPSRAAKVSVMGDRTSGYNSTNANAVDAAILDANADTTNVVCPGDLADTTNTNYGTLNNSLKNALIAVGGDLHPAAGNWDYSNSISAFKSYFGLADTYRQRAFGEMEFFFYDTNETHAENNQTSLGASQAAPMGQWLMNALRQSKARWKIVVLHHPVYTSSTHSPGGYPVMDWEWSSLGVALVLQSHDHVAERIVKNGACYYTVGLGGAGVHAFGTPLAESQFRSTTNGYLKLYDSHSDLVLEYYDTAQNLLDRAKITRN